MRCRKWTSGFLPPLARSGADVNFTSQSDHETRLALVAGNGYFEIYELLVMFGADVNPPRPERLRDATCLSYQQRVLKMCKLLILSGTDVDRVTYNKKTPLAYAAEFGNLDICQLLLGHGARTEGLGAYLPLSIAAMRDYLNICRLLLDRGADAKAKDDNGETVLEKVVRDDGRDAITMFQSYRFD